MSSSPSRNRRTAQALTVAALLSLALPVTTHARPRPRAVHPAMSAMSAIPATSAMSAMSEPWRSLAALWHRLTSLDAADPVSHPGGGLPCDDNGGMIDPNGKPKPAPPHS